LLHAGAGELLGRIVHCAVESDGDAEEAVMDTPLRICADLDRLRQSVGSRPLEGIRATRVLKELAHVDERLKVILAGQVG
jgi:hypothetical protein